MNKDVMERPRTTRAMKILLPLLGLLALVALAMVVQATLTDNETLPTWPAQYYDFGHAYNVGTIELGTPITVRRDGGNDDDYLKLPFLAVDDLVNVYVEVSETMFATIDFWVSDPLHFPIYFYKLENTKLGDPYYFTFEFGALMTGGYFIHTGQGFGDTYMNFTITRTHVSPPDAEKDANYRPADKQPVTSGVPINTSGGLNWDPSDFYVTNIQPSADISKYLSVALDYESGTKVQWEVYSSQGILRQQEDYRNDVVGSPPIGDKNTQMYDWPVTKAGDYNIRVWTMEGYGWYQLTVSVRDYINDHNNSIDEAYEVFDGSELSADLHLDFDEYDYCKIYLEVNEPLWVWMEPLDGPVDMILADERDLKIAGNPRSGLVEEAIYNWAPYDAGYYYIMFYATYEDDFPNATKVNYTFKVWINYAPEVVKGSPTKISQPEDTTNESYNVAAWFMDKDAEDTLTYELDMSYNNTLIDIQLLPNNHLRIAPVANASGFSIPILLNATDPKGLPVNWTVTVTITPVNDPPYVNWSAVPEDIRIGEGLVRSGVNVTRPFMDIDDNYATWTFEVTTTPEVRVNLDRETWLVTLTPLDDDWTGEVTFTVTCTDKGGATASIVYKVVVYEINDPPYIKNYLPQLFFKEEEPYTIDLVTATGAPFFLDVEGATLTYAWANNTTALKVSLDGSELTLLGIKDFSGTILTMKIWAIDPLGAKSAEMQLLINVEDVPDAPTITLLKTTVTIQEGGSVQFDQDVYYEFYDPDSEPIDLTWKWFIDGVEVPATDVGDRFAYEYTAPITSEKERTVTIRLDVVDATEPVSVSWAVQITNKNVAPTIANLTTPDRPPYYVGKSINFAGEASDIDGDALTYEWYLDETTQIGTGPTISYKDFQKGQHKITLKVTDTSSASTTMDYQITIEEKTNGDDSPGYTSALAFVAIAAVVAALVLVRRRM